MRCRQLSLIAFITLILTVALPIANLPTVFPASQLLAQTPADRKAEADRLLQQGIQQFQTSQFTAALQSWQQALIIYREIKDRKGEGYALGNLGIAYYSLGEYAKAIEYHQQLLAIAREIKDRNGEGAALGNLGNAYNSLGDYPKAIEYHQQSLAIAREIKDRLGEGRSLGNLGLAYNSLGDYPKAIEYHQQSLAIAREIKNRLGEGAALGNLGLAYDALGDYPKAIEYQQQRLAIAREIKDRLGEGYALGNLGLAYQSLGDYAKAIEYHQQCLAIAREIKDRNGEGAALGNLGFAYQSLGDYAKAIEYQQQSLAIAREIKDRQGEGNALGKLGIAYYSLGDYAKAIEYQQQRLAITREIKDRLGEGAALGNLGNAYQSLGDYAKAIDYHSSSLAIAREIKDRQGEGATLGNLGNAYGSLGNYAKAIEYEQQRLSIAREIKDRLGEGNALGNLGSAYYSLGDYAKAIEYQQQSLVIAREIKDRLGEGNALGNLGNAYYSLGDYAKTIEYQQQHLAIAREIKDRLGEGLSLNNLGYALYKSGNLAAAEKTLYEGIKVYESLRDKKLADTNKVSIFETQSSIYRTLQKVLIAQKKTDAALEISERGRARAFVELLSSRLNQNNNEMKSLAASTVSDIKQIAKIQNSTLVQYSIIYDEFKVQGKQETKESEIYIWVIKPTGEITFRKADLKPLWQKENTSLAQLVRVSRQSIGVRSRGAITVGGISDAPTTKQRFQRLHELLIKPIADLLPSKDSEKVIFIPQSSLFSVPFVALQDEEGKYLIEKHTILTAPSIQALDLTHKQRIGIEDSKGGKEDILIVGNPTMPKIPITNEQLTSLPGAEKEAIQIADLLKTKAITGSKATKAAILPKMAKAKIIHFATHGLLDDFKGFGVPGAIALAPSNQDDGFLTAGEIFDLKLNAQLVVLSACDTGSGNVTGDGVIGLSRSLITAGVPSVVVSLWAVDDNSTAFLMSEFYRHLQQNPDKALALRQAMLTTKKQYSNPRNWAAFTLIGEAN
ncbi:tetratricopeptide repeat protein [Aliinostoc sp. HNIBRCY26]|uniref:tetratricopeptide repeat protein n=1 Tax=Aliinostoc sp. HNIBRCY26 TaxID=3418997 RepID=UPI003D08C236